MATNLKVHVNNSNTDDTKSNIPSSYIEMDLSQDKWYFTSGSSAVADGQDEPTEAELNEAATLISNSNDVEIPKLIMLDKSANLLKEVYLAGSDNNRYVVCFAFDGATSSEPTLEAWDDANHNAATLHCLGNGTISNSWIHAKVTTSSAPGSNWVGTKIAGSNKLLLNEGGGALSSAKDIYINIYVKIPAAYSVGATEQPVLTIRYTYS